jgi:hypothetical protein
MASAVPGTAHVVLVLHFSGSGGGSSSVGGRARVVALRQDSSVFPDAGANGAREINLAVIDQDSYLGAAGYVGEPGTALQVRLPSSVLPEAMWPSNASMVETATATSVGGAAGGVGKKRQAHVVADIWTDVEASRIIEGRVRQAQRHKEVADFTITYDFFPITSQPSLWVTPPEDHVMNALVGSVASQVFAHHQKQLLLQLGEKGEKGAVREGPAAVGLPQALVERLRKIAKDAVKEAAVAATDVLDNGDSARMEAGALQPPVASAASTPSNRSAPLKLISTQEKIKSPSASAAKRRIAPQPIGVLANGGLGSSKSWTEAGFIYWSFLWMHWFTRNFLYSCAHHASFLNKYFW